MDEALYKTAPIDADPVGPKEALEALDAGVISDVHDFRCPDDECNVDVMLKAIKPTAKLFPYFGAAGSATHGAECEYGDSSNPGIRGTSFDVSGNLTLQSGALIWSRQQPSQHITAPATPASGHSRRSRLTVRGLVRLAGMWTYGELQSSTIRVAQRDRYASRLFFDAAWYALVTIKAQAREAPHVVWPHALGRNIYYDMTKNPYIILGDATLQRGTFPPRVVWSVPTSLDTQSVSLNTDTLLFQRSGFKRRLRKECERIGWAEDNDAPCFAIAFAHSHPADGKDIEIKLATSYTDLFVLPIGTRPSAALIKHSHYLFSKAQLQNQIPPVNIEH